MSEDPHKPDPLDNDKFPNSGDKNLPQTDEMGDEPKNQGHDTPDPVDPPEIAVDRVASTVVNDAKTDRPVDRTSSDQVGKKSNDDSDDLNYKDSIEKTDLEFRSYGIITFLILPAIWAFIFALLQNPLIFVLAAGVFFLEKSFIRRGHVMRFSSVLAFLPYHIARLSLGAKLSKKNSAQLRYWWFLSIGGFLILGIVGLVFISFYLIIPPIFIFYKRKQFLSLLFILAFLPRGEYFASGNLWITDTDSIERRKKDKQIMSEEYGYVENDSYFHFYPPNRIAKITAYFTIIIIPVGFIIILQTLARVTVDSPGLRRVIINAGAITLGYGLIAIIPYIILMSLRKRRITRIVTTKMAQTLVETISHSTLSSIPIFSGDYFLEENSSELYMHHNFGFFEIFRGGRLITLILLPVSIIASVFGSFLSEVEPAMDEKVTTKLFLEKFVERLQSPDFGFAILILIPLTLSIILPLIWVLKDAEIKRATWKTDESDGSKKEISSVEDLGSMFNGYFSLFIGVSAITNLTILVFDLLAETPSQLDGILIFFIIIVFAIVIVLPGTFFMAFRYFATGDHAAGVNYLRYNLSQDPDIAVGSISQTYLASKSLPLPKSQYIQRQLGI